MDETQDLAVRMAALERGAEWEAALDTCALAFAAAWAARRPAGIADATRGAARMLCELGRLEEAEEQAELSREVAARCGLGREAARAANVLGAVRYAAADIEGAAALYEAALAWAREVRDDELIGLACANLGVVANIRGELRAASAFYLESIAAAVRTGNVQASILGYNNLGMLSADVREWMQADLLFHRALELAEQAGDSSVTPMLVLNRAEPLIQVGELDAAEAVLDRAEAMVAGVPNDREMAEAARFRGLLARRRGDEAGARTHLARSLLLATRAGLPLERAEALEQLGLLHHDAGRVDEARAHLEHACAEFESAGAARDCARLREVLAQWGEDEDRVAADGTPVAVPASP